MSDLFNESEKNEKMDNSSMEFVEGEDSNFFSLPKDLQARPNSSRMRLYFIIEAIALFAPMLLSSFGVITKGTMTIIYIPVVIVFIIVPMVIRHKARKKMDF